MPRFNIPKQFQAAFHDFLQLSVEDRRTLIKELKEAPIGLLPKELSNNLSKVALEKEKIAELLEMIFSLMRGQSTSDLDLDSFVDGIIEALVRLEGKQFQDINLLKQHLTELLTVNNSIYFTAKATILATDREKVFLKTRILTDIRPVFSENEKNGCEMKASLILHNLKIEYQENNDQKEVYYALDSKDLEKLKDAILRAEEKEKAIKESYKLVDVPFINLIN